MRRFRIRLGHDRSGVAAIEMAFALPILLVMIVGMLSSGSIYVSKNALNNAVGDAARYATIAPQPSDTQIGTMLLSSYRGTAPLNSNDITITHGQTADYVHYIDVKARVKTSLYLVFMRVPGITLIAEKRAYVI